jgi:hypothetical protein
MDTAKSFHEIDTTQKYLTNINDYRKDKNDSIFYIWKYIKPQDINSIKASTSQELLQSLNGFSIEIKKKSNSNWIYVWPLQLDIISKKLINTLWEEKKEQAVTIYNIPEKKHIFNSLIWLWIQKKEQKISIESIHNLYKSIEDLLDQDLSKYIIQYQKEHWEFVVESWYLYNPILHTQLKKILQKIHWFIDGLTQQQQNGIIKNPSWLWTIQIRENASLYLYEKYHSSTFNTYYYQNSISNIEKNFIQISNILELDWQEEFDNIVKSLQKSIRAHISSIHTKPQQDDDYENICDDIFKQIIIPFIDTIDDDKKEKKCEPHFNAIEEEIINLLMTKQYDINKTWPQKLLKETTDTLSAPYLFNKLVWYHNSDDEENYKSCLIALQACNDKEIKNLLSKNKWELLDILTQREEYEFAARIRDILQSE